MPRRRLALEHCRRRQFFGRAERRADLGERRVDGGLFRR